MPVILYSVILSLIVYVSLLAEFMGTSTMSISIEQNWTETEPKRINLYWTTISTLYCNRSIQDNSTDSLDPPLRLTRYHRDPGKMAWLDITRQSATNKSIVKQKTSPHRWHPKLSKMTAQCSNKDGKAAKEKISCVCVQWLIISQVDHQK